MDIINRISVNYISGQKFGCLTDTVLEIKTFRPVNESNLLVLVNLAGFYGQEIKIIKSWTEPADKYNLYYLYTVRISCDSGD